jgi:hypothetical protein
MREAAGALGGGWLHHLPKRDSVLAQGKVLTQRAAQRGDTRVRSCCCYDYLTFRKRSIRAELSPCT